MSKTKNSVEIDIGHNFCECGNYLYSITEKRIKIARGNKITFSRNKFEIEIICSHCNKETKIKL